MVAGNKRRLNVVGGIVVACAVPPWVAGVCHSLCIISGVFVRLYSVLAFRRWWLWTSVGPSQSVVLLVLVLYFWASLALRHSWYFIPDCPARLYGFVAPLR